MDAIVVAAERDGRDVGSAMKGTVQSTEADFQLRNGDLCRAQEEQLSQVVAMVGYLLYPREANVYVLRNLSKGDKLGLGLGGVEMFLFSAGKIWWGFWIIARVSRFFA